MAIVSVAIIISFHLKNEPSPVEKKVALPVGVLFWVLSFACLANGFANYVKTVTKYGRRSALVQSGWKTQVVSFAATLCFQMFEMEKGELIGVQIFTIVACAIVAVCVLFLSTNAQAR